MLAILFYPYSYPLHTFLLTLYVIHLIGVVCHVTCAEYITDARPLHLVYLVHVTKLAMMTWSHIMCEHGYTRLDISA